MKKKKCNIEKETLQNKLNQAYVQIKDMATKTDNYPIKKCHNCGMYFIQKSRLLN